MTAETFTIESTVALSADYEISAEEWQVRRDLAACYRLVALDGQDDLTANHITARVTGEPGSFLINPFGMLFEEVTASNLIKIDRDGNILSPTEYPINTTGFVIHGAVHEAREDAFCVLHLHTDAGVAMSVLNEVILPLNQTAMLIADDIAYHEYEGLALDLAERETLVRDLGDKHLMMLWNHGTLTLGTSVAEAYQRHYFLEKSATVQLKAMAAARVEEFHAADPEVIKKVAEAAVAFRDWKAADKLVWPALLRKLDRICPDYKE